MNFVRRSGARTREARLNQISKISIEETADQRWSRFTPIVTGDDYVQSLRGRDVTVYSFGELVAEPVNDL